MTKFYFDSKGIAHFLTPYGESKIKKKTITDYDGTKLKSSFYGKYVVQDSKNYDFDKNKPKTIKKKTTRKVSKCAKQLAAIRKVLKS